MANMKSYIIKNRSNRLITLKSYNSKFESIIIKPESDSEVVSEDHLKACEKAYRILANRLTLLHQESGEYEKQVNTSVSVNQNTDSESDDSAEKGEDDQDKSDDVETDELSADDEQKIKSEIKRLRNIYRSTGDKKEKAKLKARLENLVTKLRG